MRKEIVDIPFTEAGLACLRTCNWFWLLKFHEISNSCSVMLSLDDGHSIVVLYENWSCSWRKVPKECLESLSMHALAVQPEPWTAEENIAQCLQSRPASRFSTLWMKLSARTLDSPFLCFQLYEYEFMLYHYALAAGNIREWKQNHLRLEIFSEGCFVRCSQNDI